VIVSSSWGRLAALVGSSPDYGLALIAPNLVAPTKPSGDVGSDVIAARPDVMAAKMRIEAAAARVKVARRDFYPNISLSALGGFQSLDLPQLLTFGSAIPSFGAAIHLPIFDSGRLNAAYHAQQAEYDGVVANYNAALINALSDASSALVRERASVLVAAGNERVMANALHFEYLAQKRLHAKLTSELPVLSAAAMRIQAQSSRDAAKLQVISNQIDLARALGGQIVTAARSGE